MRKAITSRAENYSQWYVDIVIKAELADYGPTKGTMVIRPYGYAIWDRMRSILDEYFKKSGHSNAYFPLLIPQHFLEKEAEHVEGFSPQTAVVTIGGGETLDEPLVIRPTSETIIWKMYGKWINSYRDLPLLINQWANVVRWEKRTRLFLRTSEFLWQEGHTAHASREEAEAEVTTMLGIYKEFAERYMGVSVLSGQKSESEKFAGAVTSHSIEAMMQDKKALQAGTSHFLGQNFAKAFDVKYQTKQGKEEYVWATSWGVSTRLIGALIMSHSDDRGLVLPPRLAPIEIVIVPIVTDSTASIVMPAVERVRQVLVDAAFRVKLDDDSQNTPGWKFSQWEMKGVPVRIECGKRDVDKGCVTVVRRDRGERVEVAVREVAAYCRNQLQMMQSDLLQNSTHFRTSNTHVFTEKDELVKFLSDGAGFAEVLWDGAPESEAYIKKQTSATTRVILEPVSDARARCVISGNPAKYRVIFAKSY